MTTRLNKELRLLYKAEAEHKIPAVPIIRQLIVDSERPLPDMLPPQPEWKVFEWPRSGEVRFTHERLDVRWSEQ